ncbi:hypothetical protein D3C85_929590 [compost metagenome]
MPYKQAERCHAQQAVGARNHPEKAEHEQHDDEGHAHPDRGEGAKPIHREQRANEPDREGQQHHRKEGQHLSGKQKGQELFEILHE